MRIATLQFAPKLGDVDGNIQRANDLLNRGKVIYVDGEKISGAEIKIERLRPDVLVLPELALTGMYTIGCIAAGAPRVSLASILGN